MTADRQTDRLPVDGFCPKFDKNLQIMCQVHIPNFIPVALIVFELSCLQTDTHTDIIPKLCFSDSGRSKTWRFVKISSSNFLSITIISLCILRIRESKKIQNADALSRHPLETPETDIPSPPEVLIREDLHNPPVKADEISQATLRDPVLSRVLNWVIKGWLESEKECRIIYLKRHELSVHKNCLLWGNRVVVPEVLRRRVLDELHISHPGIEKMKSLARCYVWWPKIEEDIENHVGLCEPCQQTRHAPPRSPVHPWEVTTKPWSKVHIYFAGHLPRPIVFLACRLIFKMVGS
ncbi:hypothetical protein AVEN_196503-1 [Araneus ventricosus]|uniref:RNA-directed DNA polymerase n=1 Tax=Araneus ventricosus TaxID=182803 RepID=A0A4Y2TIH3_ARAVE|nr:hypothetical protein AVEN_196503-1 [Araneus ventricosus]